MRKASTVNVELARSLAMVVARLERHRAEPGHAMAVTVKNLVAHKGRILVVFEAIRRLMAEKQAAETPTRVGSGCLHRPCPFLATGGEIVC
jgi:hypothetical protein